MDNYLLNNVRDIKTALVFPPIIYGEGRGPINQRSVQIPQLAKSAIETRETVQVGKGESTWSNIHVGDVTDLFVKLIEKASEGAADDLWNKNGLYFVANGQLVRQSEHSTDKIANPSRALERSRNWSPKPRTISVSQTRLL